MAEVIASHASSVAEKLRGLSVSEQEMPSPASSPTTSAAHSQTEQESASSTTSEEIPLDLNVDQKPTEVIAAVAPDAVIAVAQATPAITPETLKVAPEITTPPPAPDTITKDQVHVPDTKLPPSIQTATKPSPLYPVSKFDLIDRFIDDPRPLRVAVIGGGLSGVLAGILFPAKVPNIQLTIYEKNKDFGGTWLENVYPGVRCDIPSHVYQSTFEQKIDWSDRFAPGAEIRDYWQGIATKYNVHQYARFGHRVEDLTWDNNDSVWKVTLTDVGTGETKVEVQDFVLTAIGRFNAWKLPDYSGINDYEGVLRHASHYDPTFDPTGKKVAVIGNGASGIQLVANLQKVVGHLDHYARNRTWIAGSWAPGDERTLEPQAYTPEQVALFKSDPSAYLAFRKTLEDKYWRRFSAFFRGSAENAALRTQFTEIMRKRLAAKPELLEHILPDFSPNCRRLTPGPGYLEAIASPNVSYIRTPISHFTEIGITTTDGKSHPVDAVFCATGANVNALPPFSIHGPSGIDLRTLWDPVSNHPESHHFPYSYLGQATPGFPNLFFIHGPHGTGPSGTVPHSVENQLAMYAKFLRKVSREGIKTIAPSRSATDEFIAYSDAFFNDTVLSDHCSSWYNGAKPGGRIHGIWPGSAGHVTQVRREPRWEDWEYTYLGVEGNRFAWYFGNGWTGKEADGESDMTNYLKKPGEPVDLRDVHESWWELPGVKAGKL
jgi:cation diffusion facilitator CzcD-associated flavoprotein CzcO